LPTGRHLFAVLVHLSARPACLPLIGDDVAPAVGEARFTALTPEKVRSHPS
jgi:hypothetical protein